jgi:hypothetical protein
MEKANRDDNTTKDTDVAINEATDPRRDVDYVDDATADEATDVRMNEGTTEMTYNVGEATVETTHNDATVGMTDDDKLNKATVETVGDATMNEATAEINAATEYGVDKLADAVVP